MKKELTVMKKLKISSKEYFDGELDFNKYLTNEEGISVLSETLEVNLGNPIKEKIVQSKKRIDLVFEVDGDNNDQLIVESQFHKSNHDHLGKIISYASQSEKYKYIVWVVEEVDEIHISAIKMLNDYFSNSEKPRYFYIIKAEILKLEQQAALNLELLEKPDLEEIVTNADKKVHESARLQQKFWLSFNKYVKSKGGDEKASPAQHWLNFTLENKISKISNGSYTVSPKQGWLRVNINYRKDIGNDDDIKKVETLYESFKKHFESLGYIVNYTNREDRSLSTLYIQKEFSMDKYGTSDFDWMLKSKSELENFIKQII